MKASELMVGDWVNYRPGWIDEETGKPEYECGEGFPVKITCIYDCLAQYDDMLPDGTINTIEVANYELSGIPITPEILEKNGFAKEKEDELGITYYFLARPFTTQITLYKEPIGGVSILFKVWGRVPSSEVGVNDIHLCSVKYVHEMQHALRLCGIEKEIEL